MANNLIMKLLEIYWLKTKQLKFIPLLNLFASVVFLLISIIYTLSLLEGNKINLFDQLLMMVTFGISGSANFHIFYQALSSSNLQKNYKDSIGTLLLSSWVIFWILSFLLFNLAPLIMFTLSILMLIILFMIYRFILSSLIIALMAITSLIVISYNNIGMFEESFCWKVGNKTDPTGVALAEPTPEEKLEGYTKMGIAWRAHRNCHKNFNLFSAIRTELNFK